MANKVKYGLKNVYYAVATQGAGGALTYGTPVAWPGAVNLTMSQVSGESTFYADNVAYFKTEANNGYEGEFESALIPDSFRTDVLGEILDDKGFYVEKSGQPTVEFALLFQFEGDQTATRHCFYRCVASRPDVNGSTVQENVEVQTETLSLSALARINDQVVKSRCPASADSYESWFTSVQEPTAA